MEYRPLGRTGVLVSPLCLGAMNFGGPTNKDDSFDIIDRALEAGINFIDTANVYNGGESERIVGEALERNGKRDQVVLATKVYNKVGPGPNDQGNTRYHIIKACEDSLRRLRTDHIDLYQLHRPSLSIPQDETLRALDDLVRAGKVRYIGASTFPAWMIMEAIATSERYGWVRFVSEQPPYNLLDRRIENELVPVAERYGMAILPWSPLAGGLLSGRYRNDAPPPSQSRAEREPDSMFVQRVRPEAVDVATRLTAYAQERDLTTAQFGLLWCRDQPGITAPIIGPRTRQHLDDTLAIVDRALSDEDRAFCDGLVHPGNVVADFHNSANWMKTRI